MNFYTIFAASLETFKAFDNLEVTHAGQQLANSPKTIWQILNHLIIWQEHQLNQLAHLSEEISFDELSSWIPEKSPRTDKELSITVQEFEYQLATLKQILRQLVLTDVQLEAKLKIIQTISSHLSFHIGEVIHLRRVLGTYPQPEQMADFLAG